MCSRFPDFGKELLGQRRHQITDAFRAAGAAFHAEHALDHQHMMITPERDLGVMLDQQVLHYEKIGVFFGMSEDLDDRRDFFLVFCDGKTVPLQQRPKRVDRRDPRSSRKTRRSFRNAGPADRA